MGADPLQLQPPSVRLHLGASISATQSWIKVDADSASLKHDERAPSSDFHAAGETILNIIMPAKSIC